MGITQDIYSNITAINQGLIIPKPGHKTGPGSDLEIQYFTSEMQVWTLKEDINSPHSLHKNLLVIYLILWVCTAEPQERQKPHSKTTS